MKRWPWLALLAVATAVGAFLRFDRLGVPSYWLDEILHQHLTDTAAATPWWRWFGRLHEEHAGLYYLTQLATRALGRGEFAGRTAAALCGVVTIPLLWLVPLDRRVRISAAILLAISPLHVYYSREARGYALLVLLTTAMIVILMRGRSRIAAALVLLAMLYSSAVASTVVASTIAICLLVALLDRERRRWFATVGAMGGVALLLFRAVYASRPLHDPTWPSFPAIDGAFLTSLARMFSVTAFGTEIAGRAAAATFVFAIIGAVMLVRRNRAHGIVLIGMTLLPLAITFAALQLFDHFFAVRYVIASLPGYLLLAGAGMAAVTTRVPAIATLVIVSVTAAQGWTSARIEPLQKLDWRGIAKTLRAHVRPGDVILAAEPWSDVSLRYYLGEIPNVKLIYMAGVGIADIVRNDAKSAWLVTAGGSADTSVRTWMCRDALVLASPLENFRLHYAPSHRDLFQHRSTLPEQRAVAAALGESFKVRLNDDLLLGEGWANLEGDGVETFRWAVGKRATIVIPRRSRRDHAIRFHAYPVVPQNVSVSLNGRPLGTVALRGEWSDVAIAAPLAFWNVGMNTIAFDFEKAVVPSPNDPRELAVSFRWFGLDDGPFVDMPSTRIGFVGTPLPHRDAARIPRRDATETLLGRLGFDPDSTWPRIADGTLRIEDLAATVAAGSDCESDEAFLQRAFAVLVQHPPNEGARNDLLGRLRDGATREHIVARIVKSDDFRDRLSADR